MERHLLDKNASLALLLESENEVHVGYPVVLQPRSEERDEIRLDEAQAQILYQRLRAYYRRRLAVQVRNLLVAQLHCAEGLEAYVGHEAIEEMRRTAAGTIDLAEDAFLRFALPSDDAPAQLSDAIIDHIIVQSQRLARFALCVDGKAGEEIRRLLGETARLTSLPFLMLPGDGEQP